MKRSMLSWIVVAVLFSTLVGFVILDNRPVRQPATEFDDVLTQFADAMQAGDVAETAVLYHTNGQHRDLSNGQFATGYDEIEQFFREQYTLQEGVLGVEVFSVKMRSPTVAIINLDVTNHVGLPETSAWPPFVVIVLTYENDSWGIAASRAGGNPDTHETGVIRGA